MYMYLSIYVPRFLHLIFVQLIHLYTLQNRYMYDIYIYIYILFIPAARALRPRGTSTYTLSYGFYMVSLGSLLGFL